mgnify:CR=1 FL=1
MSKTKKDKILQQVAGFVARNQLLAADNKYIVALSGGADSVALLLIMKALGYDVEAAHCNFHLRGKESERDENFCVSLCESLGIILHRIHFDTLTYAQLHKVSIEMAARDLRYSYFEQLRRDINADAICVAHHKDDNVETILLNLVRGTGMNGLTGISPRNGFILRPLLCVGREDILEYLEAENQDYVTDSSNLVDDVQRNKIRLNVLPLLENVNPAVKDNILTMARWIAEASTIVEASLSEAKAKAVSSATLNDSYTVDISKVEEYPSAEYLLWNILSDYGFNSSQVALVAENLHATTGTSWLSSSHELTLDRGRLILTPLDKEEGRQMRIPEVGTYVYTELYKLKIEQKEINENYTISRSSDKVCLDAQKVKFPLMIRRVARGDRFVPFGMKGSKLVSDFLTDQKVALPLKRRQLVVADAGGNILWVVGKRLDGRFAVSPCSKSVVEISLLS